MKLPLDIDHTCFLGAKDWTAVRRNHGEGWYDIEYREALPSGKCPGCAYERGYNDAKAEVEREKERASIEHRDLGG